MIARHASGVGWTEAVIAALAGVSIIDASVGGSVVDVR